MDQKAKIYVAGHNGMVGSAIMRHLCSAGYTNVVVRSRAELDLLDQSAVSGFFSAEHPEYVFLAAAKVGGIWANSTKPAEFIYENLMMEANIIHAAWQHGSRKLLFLGSSCIYPKLAPQPIKEDYLLTGELEGTNKPYAIAKIAGIEMCQSYNRQYGTDYIAVMPTNLYGSHDNFDLETSHVLPALLRKFHEAKLKGSPEVTVWGTGTPVREFLHVDDLADACVFLIKSYSGNDIVNIGCGEGITIKELAERIKTVVGYKGRIRFDSSKPDGTPIKVNDINRLTSLGWKYHISLEEGLSRTYRWYLDANGVNGTIK